MKKSLHTESIPLLLSQAERSGEFDGDDSDFSDDMTPFKKHNIYYKSRWARVYSLLFCGLVSYTNIKGNIYALGYFWALEWFVVFYFA